MATFDDYATSGNIGNAVSLLFIVPYTVSGLFLRDFGLFDPEWTQHGFCISNPEVEFLTSHDTSLYADTILFIVMVYLYLQWKDVPHMKGSGVAARVPHHAFGILGHGMGHAYLSYAARTGMTSEYVGGSKSKEPLVILGMMAVFWFPILMPVIYRLRPLSILMVALVAAFGQSRVQVEFLFLYTQSIIAIGSCLNQLSTPREEKITFDYFTWPWVVTLPIILTGWAEALLCNSFYFKAIGGHVWFDACIGISITTQYVLSYCYHKRAATASKKHKML